MSWNHGGADLADAMGIAHTPPRPFDVCVCKKIPEKFGPESLIQTQLDLRCLVY
jgi:hypothetical protein